MNSTIRFMKLGTVPLTMLLLVFGGCASPLPGIPPFRNDGELNLSLPPVAPDESATVENQNAVGAPGQTVLRPQAERVIRNQNANPASYWGNDVAPDGSDRSRLPMQPSGATTRQLQQAQYTNPAANRAATLWGMPSGGMPPASTYPAAGNPQNGIPSAANQVYTQQPVNPGTLPPPSAAVTPGGSLPPGGAYPAGPVNGQVMQTMVAPNGQVIPQYASPDGPFDPAIGLPTPLADIFVNVQETQTGRFMLGASVNSDAGVTGQIVIDEKNFDWRRVPTSYDDFLNGSAFRGAGQAFRLELLPGDEVQRYMLNFTNPYLFNTRISMNLSGYLYDRQFFDWDEQRLGGRIGFGYRITPDLSLRFAVRAEEVTISDPRVAGVADLDAAVGSHDLFGGRVTLIQDTRDIPFQPTQGYYLELAFEQVFGSFDYSRGEIDYRRYFLLAERPDGSGRHILGFSNRLGFSGNDTPIFENYFAGGYATMRGFDFRRASPQDSGVTVGGEFQLLGSVEYLFPITADDMLKGVAFCDYGTVEEDIEINADDYRVSLGLGLRIFVPAMGPAPIALDFAVPIARESTDEIRQFSFNIGVSR